MADDENKVQEAEAAVTEQPEQGQEAPAPEAPAKAASKPAKADKADKAEKPAAASKMPADYQPRLRRDYDERIVPAMIERFGYKNRMEVPRLDKIVINMGVGEA